MDVVINEKSEYNEGDMKWFFVPDCTIPIIENRKIIQVGFDEISSHNTLRKSAFEVNWWYKLERSGMSKQDDIQWRSRQLFNSKEEAIQSIKINEINWDKR